MPGSAFHLRGKSGSFRFALIVTTLPAHGQPSHGHCNSSLRTGRQALVVAVAGTGTTEQSCTVLPVLCKLRLLRVLLVSVEKRAVSMFIHALEDTYVGSDVF